MQEHYRPEVVEDQPREGGNRAEIREAADFLAWLLDTAIQIPGTRIRIGLDPLLGLLPGIGDALASLIGSAILVMASQLQVPKIVIARMSLNILINGMVGAVPVLGDAFSIWFRSNARNAYLLQRHSSSVRRPSTASDWIVVVGVLALTLAATIGAIAAIMWLIMQLWELVQ